MSPEQARGRGIDERSDVYAVGIMLYEMMTGMVPFAGESFMDVLTKQLSEAPPPPRSVAPGARISEELEAVILKALAKNPDHRYQSMRELAEAVAAVAVEGEVTLSRRAAPPSREKMLLTAVVVLAVVSVVQLVMLVVLMAT